MISIISRSAVVRWPAAPVVAGEPTRNGERDPVGPLRCWQASGCGDRPGYGIGPFPQVGRISLTLGVGLRPLRRSGVGFLEGARALAGAGGVGLSP